MDSLAVQNDLFQVTAYDPPLRDNRDVMEYPFLSIQKGRSKTISFTSPDKKIHVEVAGSQYGLATIWDWDLMIYLSAHINDAIENGHSPSQWIEFAPYDALRYMNRGTSGRHYQELVKTLRRLATTNIITSIRLEETTGSEGIVRWIESYSIPKRYSENEFIKDLSTGEADPKKPWRVKIPDWIFNSITRRTGILAVHPQYFELKGGLERWIYRLARKAVPDKADMPAIKFKMETLHKRSGSTRPLRQFAADIRKIAEKNSLPEYTIIVHKEKRYELVTLLRDKSKPRRLPRGLVGIT